MAKMKGTLKVPSIEAPDYHFFKKSDRTIFNLFVGQK